MELQVDVTIDVWVGVTNDEAVVLIDFTIAILVNKVDVTSTEIDRIVSSIADELAIGMVNQKTTAVRIIPVIGKGVGETVEFGGLLGHAPIMPVNRFGCENFVNRGGRIPAPIHSFKN